MFSTPPAAVGQAERERGYEAAGEKDRSQQMEFEHDMTRPHPTLTTPAPRLNPYHILSQSQAEYQAQPSAETPPSSTSMSTDSSPSAHPSHPHLQEIHVQHASSKHGVHLSSGNPDERSTGRIGKKVKGLAARMGVARGTADEPNRFAGPPSPPPSDLDIPEQNGDEGDDSSSSSSDESGDSDEEEGDSGEPSAAIPSSSPLFAPPLASFFDSEFIFPSTTSSPNPIDDTDVRAPSQHISDASQSTAEPEKEDELPPLPTPVQINQRKSSVGSVLTPSGTGPSPSTSYFDPPVPPPTRSSSLSSSSLPPAPIGTMSYLHPSSASNHILLPPTPAFARRNTTGSPIASSGGSLPVPSLPSNSRPLASRSLSGSTHPHHPSKPRSSSLATNSSPPSRTTPIPGVDGLGLDSDILAQAEKLRKERLSKRARKAQLKEETSHPASAGSSVVVPEGSGSGGEGPTNGAEGFGPEVAQAYSHLHRSGTKHHHPLHHLHRPRSHQQTAGEVELPMGGGLTAGSVVGVGPGPALEGQEGQLASALAQASAAKTGQEQDDAKVLVGNLIGEDHVNYVLMYNMLTGIRIGVSRCQAKIARPLTDEDYKARHKFSFDIVGNELTPSARYDFKFKDYAPWVFRDLRDNYFHLDAADYLLSLTAKYILSELGSPGKSGSFFYFSRDYRFIIKTISHTEHKFLRSILKDYHEHIKNNPHTLLSRFYGLHRVKLPRGRKIHFVIMNNLFPPHRDIHETYDLKGSSVGREYPEEKAKTKKGAVLKDINWVRRNRSLQLGPEKAALLGEQLRRDAEFLKRMKIMDYSLLVGIHLMQRGNRDNVRQSTLQVFDPSQSQLPPTGLNRRRTSSIQTTADSIALRKAIQRADPKTAAPNGSTAVDHLSESDTFDRKHFLFYQDEGGLRSTDETNEPLEVIYYLGVIDICTPYSFVKKVEHMWKSFTEDRHGISAVPPTEYGNRFLRFLLSVMPNADPELRPAGLRPEVIVASDEAGNKEHIRERKERPRLKGE